MNELATKKCKPCEGGVAAFGLLRDFAIRAVTFRFNALTLRAFFALLGAFDLLFAMVGPGGGRDEVTAGMNPNRY